MWYRTDLRLVLALALSLLLSIILSRPVSAVMSGDESQRAPSGDVDYAAGIAAFDRADWQGVVDHMTKVIEQRPWHDNAHSLIGFAYRKLGDYQRSLDSYGTALLLNPHNRGALEYLGEAYLELDRPADARQALDRLETECNRITVGLTEGGCEEWVELKAAYDAYLVGTKGSNVQAR